MICMKRTRSGATLLELLVAIGVIAVLLGLLLMAVQSARQSAERTEAMNSARQLLLATRGFADSHGGRLPNADGMQPNPGLSIPQALCKQLGGDPFRQPPWLTIRSSPSPSEQTMPPPTPPAGSSTVRIEGCSFAFNSQVFRAESRLDTGIPDGLSNTLSLTEHYKNCQGAQFHYEATETTCRNDGVKTPCTGPMIRRATFADYPMFDDIHPVSVACAGRAVTTGSLPLTFQVQPSASDCDPRIPQSSLPGGILAGMLDGSVKFINPNVTQEVFWGSVTPAGGEAVTLD